MAHFTHRQRRGGFLRQMALAVPVCLLIGGIAQAQPCPAPPGGNQPPGGGGVGGNGGGGGVPQLGGNQGIAPQRTTGGSGGQFNGQGAFQLVNLAQQAMQFRQRINYRQADQTGRQQPQQSTRTRTSKKIRSRVAKSKDKSRPMTKREKLVARLKLRKQERQQKADDLRERRGRSS